MKFCKSRVVLLTVALAVASFGCLRNSAIAALSTDDFAIPAPKKVKQRVKRVKKAKPVEAPVVPLDVPVPHSELAIKPLAPVPRNPLIFELTASGWSPRQMNEESYLADASDLRNNGLPKFNLNLWAQGFETSALMISPIWGFSFSQLERSGTVSFAMQDKSAQQAINFFSVRLGIAVETKKQFWFGLKPYLALALLPTLETAPVTPLSNGISRTFMAAEVGAGLAMEVQFIESALGLRSFAFEVGVDATHGALGRSFSGVGVSAGSKVTL